MNTQLVGTEVRGFKVTEAYGNPKDLEWLISDAISIAGWTGSVGATSQMETEGVITASVTVERVKE